MNIFDNSKDIIGKTLGSATDEALRTIMTQFAGAVKTVSKPSASAVSGKLARAYNSGVTDADNKVPMRIPAFCYDNDVENDDLIAEYMRGYNEMKSKKSLKRTLIFVGVGVGGLLFYAMVSGCKIKKKRKDNDGENG